MAAATVRAHYSVELLSALLWGAADADDVGGAVYGEEIVVGKAVVVPQKHLCPKPIYGDFGISKKIDLFLKLLKSKEIGEDDEKSKEKIIQTITDDHIKSVDEKVSSKEKEIMTI